MKIESFFPGRLRVSSPLFARQENLDRIHEHVRSMEGITSISGNLRTGSLTVVYDSTRISIPMLMSAKEEIERLELEQLSTRKSR